MLKARLFHTQVHGTDTCETYLVNIDGENILIEHWFDKTDYNYAIFVLDEETQERVNAYHALDDEAFNDVAGMVYILDKELA